MKINKRMRVAGLIHLKPEYEERYIILHKYPFPGVLKRLRKSHLTNYSIFLRDGLLFSYHEYTGVSYEEDMNKIRLDPTTRDWWKLTDPMQETLSSGKETEWWASLEELFLFTGESGSKPSRLRRFALTARIESHTLLRDLVAELPSDTSSVLRRFEIHGLSLYLRPPSHLFLYGETTSPDLHQLLSRLIKESCFTSVFHVFNSQISPMESRPWRPMTEVFHMD